MLANVSSLHKATLTSYYRRRRPPFETKRSASKRSPLQSRCSILSLETPFSRASRTYSGFRAVRLVLVHNTTVYERHKSCVCHRLNSMPYVVDTWAHYDSERVRVSAKETSATALVGAYGNSALAYGAASIAHVECPHRRGINDRHRRRSRCMKNAL